MSKETECKPYIGWDLFVVHQPAVLADGRTMCVWTWVRGFKPTKADNIGRREHSANQAHLESLCCDVWLMDQDWVASLGKYQIKSSSSASQIISWNYSIWQCSFKVCYYSVCQLHYRLLKFEHDNSIGFEFHAEGKVRISYFRLISHRIFYKNTAAAHLIFAIAE